MGGRGSSSGAGRFGSMSKSQQLQTIKITQKELKSAKAAETKAKKAFILSGGSYLKRTSAQDNRKAHEKYIQAKEDRENIEKKLEKYRRIYQKG